MATLSQNVAVSEALEVVRKAQHQFWREVLRLEEAIAAVIGVEEEYTVFLDTTRDFDQISDAQSLIEECREKYKEHREGD